MKDGRTQHVLSKVGPDMMLEEIIQKSANANPAQDGDYMQGGLLYCGECHTPKQCLVNICGEKRIVYCRCTCREQAYNAQKKADEEQQRRMAIKALRTSGLMDKPLQSVRFDMDDGHDPKHTQMCKRYVEHFDVAERDNIGMLMWGDTGNGKTFFSACIANTLIDKGVPVMMTSFPRILSTVQGMYANEKASYLDDLNHYRLLVIDDLGAERQSDYALEIVYNVINARCESGRPLIVTTNLPLKELRDPEDMKYKRIYDRILSMCTPVEFTGESRRKGIAADKMKTAKEIFG